MYIKRKIDLTMHKYKFICSADLKEMQPIYRCCLIVIYVFVSCL